MLGWLRQPNSQKEARGPFFPKSGALWRIAPGTHRPLWDGHTMDIAALTSTRAPRSTEELETEVARLLVPPLPSTSQPSPHRASD